MESSNYIMREITPLSDRDCFYIADRRKTEFTYPIHCHAEFELNFTEHAAGVRRVVGDSAEVIGDYDLVLITGKELEHVWEQHECDSKEIREITIQFSPDLFFKNFMNKNQFDSIRCMLEKAQCGISFPMQAIMKVYNWLDRLASDEQGFYAVMHFLRILYELSQYDDAKVLSSSSFAISFISASVSLARIFLASSMLPRSCIYSLRAFIRSSSSLYSFVSFT